MDYIWIMFYHSKSFDLSLCMWSDKLPDARRSQYFRKVDASFRLDQQCQMVLVLLTLLA